MGERTIAVKPKVKWDFLVYIAGDNNLEQAGVRDIEEMKQVGSDDNVNILVECDYVQKDVPSKRYLISKDKPMEEDCVEIVGETNTGDPEVLKDFITWSVNSYPADRYALVIWNHGSGWDIPDIFRLVEEERIGEDKALLGRELRTSGGKNVRKTLFRTTLKEILDLPRPLRGIAYDDGSMDCLDNKEMKRVLQEALDIINEDREEEDKKDKIDIFGMDACLMSEVEVAYQIRDSVHYVVGSEETEPGDGWPYDLILAELVENPDMPPEEFAKIIVEKYIESYDVGNRSPNVTQSALNLTRIDLLKDTIDELAGLLVDNWNREGNIVRDARWDSTDFYDSKYVDLYQLAQFIKEDSFNSPIKGVAQKVLDAVASWDKGSPVLIQKHLGRNMIDTHGISIYYPFRQLSSYYANLDFAKDTNWDELLDKSLGSRGRRREPTS